MVAARRPVSPLGTGTRGVPAGAFPRQGGGAGVGVPRGPPARAGSSRRGRGRGRRVQRSPGIWRSRSIWSAAGAGLRCLGRGGQRGSLCCRGGRLGDGMSLGIGVHRVLNCTASPSHVPAGEVGTHPALLSAFGCCSLPSPCPPGARGTPSPDATMRGAPGELAMLAAVSVSVSPLRWHRGPLAGDGGGRGFPGCWHSSASAGTWREPGPLPPPHPAHQNLVKSAFCECSSPRGSS